MKRIVQTILVGAALLGSLSLPAGAGHATAAGGHATSVGIDRCHTGRLYISAGTGDAGMGHAGEVFRVRSLAQQPCTLFGYPGAQLVDANGHDLPTRLQWGKGYLFGDPKPQTVVLKTGGSAYFKLEWAHIPNAGESCPTAGYLLITPPDERTTIAIATPIDACGGRLTTTPMLATS